MQLSMIRLQSLDQRPELRPMVQVPGMTELMNQHAVHELGVEQQVYWFPLMPRREIMVGLSLADLSTGEFGFPNSGGGTVYESLAMGKPMLHYRDDDRSRRAGFSNLAPIVAAVRLKVPPPAVAVWVILPQVPPTTSGVSLTTPEG